MYSMLSEHPEPGCRWSLAVLDKGTLVKVKDSNLTLRFISDTLIQHLWDNYCAEQLCTAN